jgi:hypothetical protein
MRALEVPMNTSRRGLCVSLVSAALLWTVACASAQQATATAPAQQATATAPAQQATVTVPAQPATATVPAQQATATAPALSIEEMERFLLNARLVSTRRAGDGITNSMRATFSDGTLTHDAHIQAIDESRAIFETPRGVELDFKDSYKYNVAAYRLSRLLGMNNLPVCVERVVQGKPSSVMWWVDDFLMDEGDRMKKNETGPSPSRFAMQVHVQRVFDELIQNTDRNVGNTIWSNDWKMWLIDHTRAFRRAKELAKPERLERVDRALLAAIKGLTKENVSAAVGSSLTGLEIEALIARADAIGKLFDGHISARTEAAVLFSIN